MLKKRIIKGIILIIIGFIIYLGNSGQSEAVTNYLSTYTNESFSPSKGYSGLQYVNYVKYEQGGKDYSFFCNRLGYPPILVNTLGGFTTTGSPDISTVASVDKVDEINPQIAYAMSIGILPKNLGGDADSWNDLQELIWDANPDIESDTEEGSVDGLLSADSMWDSSLYTYTPMEVQRFRKVYEEIFQNTIVAGKSVFKLEDKDSSLFVDQNDGTYIYGPFQLKVNTTQASQNAIDYLRMEIMQKGHIKYIDYDDKDFEKSEAYIENFYKFHKSLDENFINNGVSDGNKKKLRYDINPVNKDKNYYSTIIVDSHGDPIEFPELSKGDDAGNNFFIKFYPAQEGAIINLGTEDNKAEMFNLKIKWGSYINYKEHLQTAALYTKGVIGKLMLDNEDGLVIQPGCGVASFKDGSVNGDNTDGSHDATDSGTHVLWERITFSSGTLSGLISNIVNKNLRPISWISFLEYIYSPNWLTIYDKNANNGAGGFIADTRFKHSWSDDTGTKANYYCLSNYYTNLKCVGFSTNTSGAAGSSVYMPFGFAGNNGIETTVNTKSIKQNYGFPLQQGMKLTRFYGIVKEKATATFRAGHWEREDAEPEYDEETGKQTNVGAKTSWHKVSDWTTTKTVYRYSWQVLTPEKIEANKNKISTGESDRKPAEGSTIDDTSYPSAPSDGTYDDYGSVSRDTPTWTIDTIYGGNVNYAATDKTKEYGFKYENLQNGWYYDKDFEEYEGRRVLGQALGGSENAHKYEYVQGQALGEYDVWIPKIMDPHPNINSQWAYQEYIQQQEELKAMAAKLQSFISFELGVDVMEGDVYKYGTKIHEEKVALPHLKIAEAFGGNVWKESVGVKAMTERAVDGRYDMDTEEGYAGVKVDLYECNINYKEPQSKQYIEDRDVDDGTYLTSTFTDADGDYRFYGKIAENTPLINPLKKYYVKFVYNGQIYAQTLYNVDMNSEYGQYKDKTSKGIDEYRDKFNKRFENIYADSNNYTYTGQRYAGCKGTLEQEYTYTGRAYGLKHVIQEAIDDANFNRDLDTFEEQYNLFIKNNTHADFITTHEEYEFKHAPGNRLDKPITVGTGEIVTSDIDKYWEHTPGQPIDYNFSGLANSVAEYIRDCMIEASVPYTPELTVYGKNLGMTNLKKFPETATFNLKNMGRTYMDTYVKWTLISKAKKVEDENQDTYEEPPPPEIQKYIDALNPPPTEGTVITLFEYEGEKYFHVEYPHTGKTETIKVASLNDIESIEFEDSTTMVGSEGHNNVTPRPGPEPGPDIPPGPDPHYAWGLVWRSEIIQQVRDIDHYYEPPSESYINLYNKKFDLRHCWSFGVYQRNFNEVQLEKDLYKATMVVNGKKEVYSYSGKIPNEEGGQYNFEVGELINLNKPVNGGTPYTREVRKSDYLYDENVAYGDGQYSKNIKAYLTYKIKVHNASPYTIRINEIADYYDADNLEFDGVMDENGRYQIATHTQNIDGQITTSKYTYASNLKDTAGHDVNREYIGIYDRSAYANGGPTQEEFYIANTDADNNNQPYHLKTLYIRGNDQDGHETEGIPVVTKKNGAETVTNELLPSQSTILFVTFKVKNNTIDNGISTFTNQIKLDQITRNFAEQLPTIGKNNFAEINSYASYYTAEMPGDGEVEEKQYYRPYAAGRIRYGNNEATYMAPDGTEETIPGRDICIAGVVDVYSNPGSFTDRNVEVVYTEDGKYKDLQFKDNSYRTINRAKAGFPRLNKADPDTEVLPTVEPDMDKAPSIRIILDDNEVRKISGYVFEDNRTINSDGSPIGNGKMEDGETKINGVTVQLVELIQDVDYDGTFTGQYIGEKVWDECEYTGKTDVKYQLKAGSENQGAQYYSGKGVTKYILNSLPTLTQIHTNPDNNDAAGDGKYCFAGLPSGDFIVRFIYGDTDRTVLTNGTDNNDAETTAGVRETAKVNALTGRQGMNVKSYNGQDFKSTVYQRDLASNSQVNQNAISYKMKGDEVKGYIDTLNQDYASTYNYNNNKLRTKEQLYDSNIIYYAGQPINNSGDLQPSQNGKGSDPRSNIANSYGSMWRYDRVATANNKALSDVNDLYGYRQRGIDYAQGYTTGVNEATKTLLNYRAEVLSSFERLTSQEYADGSYNKDVQNAMINELTDNTYMVAQTGIISMNNEYEGINDNDPNIDNGNEDNSTLLHMVKGGDAHENHESNVDLGLVERPRAQVKLTKNVSNIEIKLADGQTLFNANTSMKNLMYKEHSEHEINYNGNILEKVRVTLNAQTNPELIKAEIDDEIMNGATINMTYHLQVENVGEVDYIDRDFYFYGKKSGDVQPVTTKVVRVIDYVPNDVSYDASKQNEDAHWDVYKPNELVNSRITENSNANNDIAPIVDGQSFADTVAITNNGNIIRILPRTAKGDFYDKVNRDYVTRTYANEVQTYNSIVVTKDMNDDLLPTIYGAGKNIDNTTLILTTSITSSGNSEDLTYNNLAEVIETANAYGRRMQFSISGNQEMANQDINDGGGDRTNQDHHAYSSSKIVQPREIDADSAQEVQILPPTGSPEYRNKLLTIITTTIATIIVLVGAIIIKKKVYDK